MEDNWFVLRWCGGGEEVGVEGCEDFVLVMRVGEVRLKRVVREFK